MWSHIPPCAFAMMLKAEGAMQRALMSSSHVPWMGIHSSRMSRNVTVVTTAKKAMRMYVYLWNSRCVRGTRRKTKRHTETLTRNVPMLWRTSMMILKRMKLLIWSGCKYSICLPSPLSTWRIRRMPWAVAKPWRIPLEDECLGETSCGLAYQGYQHCPVIGTCCFTQKSSSVYT